MQRAQLVRLVKLMFLLLGLGLIFVLLSSISGPSNITNPANAFDDVQLGQTAARRVGSTKVWATRLSPLQRQQAKTLNAHIQEPESGCKTEQDVCAVLAATQRSGIDITFTIQAPSQLKPNTPWFGGYVDPSTGELFDRLGRAYSQTYTDRTQLNRLDF